MDLALDPAVAASYKSPSQRSRVITEHWAAATLYCPACTSLSNHMSVPPATHSFLFLLGPAILAPCGLPSSCQPDAAPVRPRDEIRICFPKKDFPSNRAPFGKLYITWKQ